MIRHERKRERIRWYSAPADGRWDSEKQGGPGVAFPSAVAGPGASVPSSEQTASKRHLNSQPLFVVFDNGESLMSWRDRQPKQMGNGAGATSDCARAGLTLLVRWPPSKEGEVRKLPEAFPLTADAPVGPAYGAARC